jgi:hypothetical protein
MDDARPTTARTALVSSRPRLSFGGSVAASRRSSTGALRAGRRAATAAAARAVAMLRTTAARAGSGLNASRKSVGMTPALAN